MLFRSRHRPRHDKDHVDFVDPSDPATVLSETETDTSARQFFNEVDLHDERCSWAFYSLPLSPQSVGRLRDLMGQVVNEMRALSRQEISLPSDKREWYRLFAGIAPVNPKTVFRRR